MISILVTNDDGIQSPGLDRLADDLASVGQVTVVAPDRERSASSHSLTLHRPLRVHERGERRFAIDGTPSDCVYLGVVRVCDPRPDLVVSGINRGSNIGDDVTYSGTIAAAIEGTILGIPSFAISQVGGHDVDEYDFRDAGIVAEELARKIVDDGLPADILLNVNVPPGDIRGIRCTRQGKHIYEEVVHEATDPRGESYYWIGSGEASHVDQPADTDYMAVHQGHVSVTPLHLDLTHYPSLEQLRDQWTPALRDSLGRVMRLDE